MGTNYYAVRNRPTVDEPIHIGKSSAGWLFLFHQVNDRWHDPPITWNTFPQIRDWLKEHCAEKQDYVIMNEYDEVVNYTEFMQIVERKQTDPNCMNNKENFYYSKNVDGYRFTEGEFC